MMFRGFSQSFARLSSQQGHVRYMTGGKVVLVDGVRTPFQMSNTGYDNFTGHQLQVPLLLIP